MAREFKLPDPGEGIHEAEILEVLVSEGDAVEEGQDVLVVETDKASLELPAPETGVIEKIHVGAGDTAKVGDVLITFAAAEKSEEEEGAAHAEEDAEADRPDEGEESESGGEDAARADAEPDADEDESENESTETVKTREDEERASDHEREEKEEQEEKKAPEEAGAKADGPADEAGAEDERRTEEDESEDRAEDAASRQETDGGRASEEDRPAVKSVPATRRLARELGVALSEVTPTGPHGRVTDEDVRKAAARAGDSPPPLPKFEQWGEVERKPLRSIRRATARHMATAWREIPHVTHMDSVAVDVLEDLRKRHRYEGAEDDADLTLTAFVMKAVVAALREHPRFNASLDPQTQEIVYKRYYNIGVAVATEKGLLVPVVREVDRKPVREVAAALAELAERARRGRASKADLSGGSFTITNVGPLGGRAFTPIVNWPDVAILGLGATRVEPVAEDNGAGGVTFAPRLMLPLCLGFDHRVNDGADAARFVATLMEILADPEKFVLAA